MTSKATTNAGGDFRLQVFPGENVFRLESLSPYIVKSIRYGTSDIQGDTLKLDSVPIGTLVVTLDRQ